MGSLNQLNYMTGISTLLVGPFDSYPTHEKSRITCGVPDEIHKPLFDEIFTRRGAQDKILARLFYVFVSALNKDENKKLLAACVTEEDKEHLANDILNQIANYDNAIIPDISDTPVNPAG